MHADPELLSLLALGEDAGTEEERVHAETCTSCASELAQLHRLVTLGRAVSAETALANPGEDVWVRIRAELALEPALEPSPDRSITLPPDPPEPLPTAARVEAAAAAHEFDDELTAHARLTPVDAFWSHASGQAELATDEHGRRLLQVALQADLPTSGLRQAWLVHRDNPELRQSLGILDGPHGLWTVEHSIDLEAYAILDISQQRTGETEHSGQTIVRGEFTLVS